MTNIKDLPIVLPAHVVPMLRDDGIVTTADWLALGARRFKLFGITRRTVEIIDEAVEYDDRMRRLRKQWVVPAKAGRA